LRELRGHEAPVEVVVIAASGTRAVSGSQDRSLRVWDLESGESLQVLKGHSGFVRAVAISQSTGNIASGSTDRTIRRWNVATSAADTSADGHDEAVSRLALSPNGDLAVSGSGGSSVLLWRASGEVASRRSIGRLEGHTDRIHAVQITADGTRAVTASRDRTLRVWDVSKRVTTHVLRGHTREIVDLETSADGRLVVSVSRDRTVRVWDIESGRAVRALVSRDNESALASLGGGDAMIAELETGPGVDISPRPVPRDPRVAVAPDGSCVVLGSQGNVCAWDLHTGALRDQDLGDLDIVAVEFAPDSRGVVMGSLFGPLLMWRFDSVPILLEGHAGRVLDVAVTSDGTTAVSAASDDTILIWDLKTSTQKRQLHCGVARPDTVGIAPYGNLAYSIYGNTLIAWDLASCARIGSVSFDHQITTISVTPTGTQLAIGDLAGRVHFMTLQVS
jgi:WD40 repeat protein